jgi:hypothetical protein
VSRRLAILVAAAVTVVFLAGAAMTPRAGAGVQLRLLPDLVTMKVHKDDLVVERAGNKTLLRLTNEIANRGRGPLEIYPSTTSHNCDGDGHPNNDRDAFQRIFLDNGDGVFDRDTDTASQHFKFGCDRHSHKTGLWEVFDLARYKLLRLHGGKRVTRSTKVAFCTVDSDHPFPGLPGSPGGGYYPTFGCDPNSILGVSVGWADEYYYGLPGQQLNVTGLKAGRYCLVSKGDPDNLLRESNNSNNVRRTRIALHPAKQTVKRLSGRCTG